MSFSEESAGVDLREECREDDRVNIEPDEGHRSPNQQLPRHRRWERKRKELGPVNTLVLEFYPHYYGLRIFYYFKPLNL